MNEHRILYDFLEPESVVIIGASEEAGRIGSGLCKSMHECFQGDVYYVNPGHEVLWGDPCYKSVRDLPAVPSHAVIAVARRFVLPSLKDCAARGIKNVVVVSSGFKETDEEGARLECEMQDFCAENDIALLGPNTLGFINTYKGYNGTFLYDFMRQGSVSVISQSGGVGMALLDSLYDQRCGIAKWMGIGNEAVLDAVQLLKVLADDPQTKVIGVCFEGLRHLPEFFDLAAVVNKKKPIVILRDGKGEAGMKAAASHTGTMAQSTKVMDGLIRQYHLLEAKSCREAAVMLKALSTGTLPKGNRTVILTNTAGPSILAADILEGEGVTLPKPSQNLKDSMDEKAGVKMQLGNPADISSNGLRPGTYGVAAGSFLESDEYDLLLGFFSLNHHLILPEDQIVSAVKNSGKPGVICFLCSSEEFAAYDLGPERESIPCFFDPQDAAIAVATLTKYAKAMRSLSGEDPTKCFESVPEKSEQDLNETDVADIIREALKDRETVCLSERESRLLLKAAGLDIEIPFRTETPEEAAKAAEEIGYPIVLKVDSEKIIHKSDVGGVYVGIRDEQMLKDIYPEMLGRMQTIDEHAGITLQHMYPEGFELIVGGVRRPEIGTLVMAGFGGVYSELMGDVSFRRVPITADDADDLLDSLTCGRVFSGYRGKILDKAAAASIIKTVADLMEHFPEIKEIDLNPCRIYERGSAILDSRVVLEKKS